eukprot:8484071-Pyramimonas_sp.AAC.2
MLSSHPAGLRYPQVLSVMHALLPLSLRLFQSTFLGVRFLPRRAPNMACVMTPLLHSHLFLVKVHEAPHFTFTQFNLLTFAARTLQEPPEENTISQGRPQ